MLRDLRGGFMQSDNLEMEDLLISGLSRIPHSRAKFSFDTEDTADSRVVPLFLLAITH